MVWCRLFFGLKEREVTITSREIAGIFALMGFVIWDRRTALTPAVRRIDDLQDRQQRIEKALRELSRENPKLAESLRNLGLL